MLANLLGSDFLRVSFSLFGLFFFWGISLIFPFRKIQKNLTWPRWRSNLSFNFANGILVKILAPLTLIEISQFTSPIQLDLNRWLSVLFSVIILDLLIYWQHRIFHKFDFLWRLHRVHHSDIEVDTTTAGRFHTLEILFSFCIKALAIFILPIPAQAVIIFEILLNFSSLFNHSNFELPEKVEKFVRFALITPHIHRIHHSTRKDEMNCNFGFSISLWDYIFRSLKLKSREPTKSMPLGLEYWRSPNDQKLSQLIKNPFLNKK